MSYIHVDILTEQSSKYQGSPCGDVIGFERDDVSTTLVLSDGLGSGIKANIAANMCVARALELIRCGATLKETFSSLVKTMNNAWGTDLPFAVFSIARILRNGETTILSYESPPPILLNKYSGNVLQSKVFTIEKAVIYESHCSIKPGDGIMLMSDGITQAGMGCGMGYGWEIDGVSRFVTDNILNKKEKLKSLPQLVHDQAREYWRKSKGDDCSVALALCRKGVTVNVLTGPPKDMVYDNEFVNSFITSEGVKIVCGGTTAKIVARVLNQPLLLKQNTGSVITPPEYTIKGVSYVTEGAVTLNQVYNILDENLSKYDVKSGVFALVEFLNIADKVNFWVGGAPNEGGDNIAFKQQHILPRKLITSLIADKLKEKGKLVVVNNS